MVTKMSVEFFKFLKNCLYLRGVLNDTLHYMEEISIANLFPGENVREMFLNNDLLESLHKDLEYKPAIVIMGQNCHTKAILVNCILGQIILPLHSSQWRWLRFQYGRLKRIRLTVAGAEFEIVENLQANDRPWMIVPEADLKRPDHEQLPEQSTILEVELPYAALRDQVQIIVTPDCSADSLSDILAKGLDQVLPVILYAISDESLNEENILEIRKYKELYPDVPILFISVAGNISPNLHDFAAELTESEQHELEEHVPRSQISGLHSEHKLQTLRRQFENLGFISSKDSSHETLDIRKTCFTQYSVNSLLISAYNINDKVTSFVRACFQFRLVKSSALLSEVHNNCLRKFILSAFDMAREIQITPRRMKYAQSREAELYRTLIEIANEKQDEITRLIQVTLQNMKANIHEILEEYNSNHTAEGTEPMPPQTMKIATTEIQQLVLQKLRNSVASELVRSFDCLKESFTGTLQRCLESLEKNFDDQEVSLSASDAVKQILNAAYNVDLKSSTSFSLVHTLMEKLRKLLHSVHIPWSTSSQLHLNAQWRQQVASDMIDSLHSNKLAKAISIQFQERIKSSHDSFQSAMRALENHYMGKLEQTDEQRVAIRKHHAPRFARLALESTSMCDMVRWGMPVQGKEIGRGQYGVVFACDPWGGVDPCAVKSVVPPDERHWNDLAMEFYYTRSITEHPRIVKLRGSVVDHSYAGGNSPAVLLIMERMIRDLYCGLRTGLSWRKRLQIAIDVVEGIRYLHSQGLVHRDIKLKNVLLDRDDRAKLTDLGFCIPEAMMSGSIVGTPVHMAPELLSGSYDSSVDVYAFGILFWYICAGHVRLPYVFEQFHNKEQLWNNVKKGIRPECLPNFDESCWHLMEQCWSGDPSHRPLLGDVQPQLEAIMKETYELIN